MSDPRDYATHPITEVHTLGSPELPGPPVEVSWIDSAGRAYWHEPDEARRSLDEMACISIGYLASDDERGVLLVMGSGAMGSWLHSMAISRQAVISVRPLTFTDPAVLA